MLGRLLIALSLVCAAVPVGAATCPTDLCACFGPAGDFDVIGNVALRVDTGKMKASGYSYPVEATISGGACAPTATFKGRSDALIDVGGDLVLLAGPGTTAVKFKAAKVYGYVDPGTTIEGDVATAGGAVLGATAVDVQGATDTSGTHPDIALCTQAKAAVLSASNTFKGLPATQTIAPVLANGGSASPTTVVTSGPGIVVVATPSITVKPAKVDGYLDGSELDIQMDSATSAIIINTPKLSVGTGCSIALTGPGADPSKVIINVTSPSGVKISQSANVEPVLLAPSSTVSVREMATVSNVYGGKTTVKGAEVIGTLPCSPGGAFLD